MYAISFRNIIMFRKTFGGLLFMKCDAMNIITATSYMARDIAINVFHSGHFNPEGYTIKYNLGEGLPNPDDIKEEDYPLIISGKYDGFPFELRIFCATAGYAGTGPHDMLKILRTAGCPGDEEAILTPKWSHDRQILIKGTKLDMKDILTSTF